MFEFIKRDYRKTTANMKLQKNFDLVIKGLDKVKKIKEVLG